MSLTYSSDSPRDLHLIFIAPAYSPPRPSLCDAWRRAIARYFPDEHQASSLFTVREGRLLEIEPRELRCDCIVSPANSFGIMDGGFDLDLSKAFQGSSPDNYHLTNHVQSHLRAHWRGFAPPATCTLVPLPSDSSTSGNPWGTHTLAVLPTMKRPEEVGWNRELVYNAMWALLCAITIHNARPDREDLGTSNESPGEDVRVRVIRKVVMTGLGTGAGAIRVERCALQMVLAVKHFVEPLPEQVRWDTEQVRRRMDGLEETMSAP